MQWLGNASLEELDAAAANGEKIYNQFLVRPQAFIMGFASRGKLPRHRWHLGCILLKMPAISLLTGHPFIASTTFRKIQEEIPEEEW